MSAITTSALPGLFEALYTRHVSLFTEDRVHAGVAPDHLTRFVVLGNDTEARSLVRDRSGTAQDATHTVNYWSQSMIQARLDYAEALTSLTTNPVVVPGFGVLSVQLDLASPLVDRSRHPNFFGVAARYRFTLNKT